MEDGTYTCTVILLCGLPASGKSTLSRQIIEISSSSSSSNNHHPKLKNTNIIHLEYDALEDELLEEKRIMKHIITSDEGEDTQNNDDHNHKIIQTARIEAWNETRSVALKEVEIAIEEWRNKNNRSI